MGEVQICGCLKYTSETKVKVSLNSAILQVMNDNVGCMKE